MPRLLTHHPLPGAVRGLLSALLTVAVLTGCDRSPPEHAFLPWDIEINDHGHVSVFGVTLGESTLLDFKRLYGQKADLAMFTKPDEPITLEAYFGQMAVGPLTAKVVLIAEVDTATLERWAEQSRIADPTPSGARKLSMSDEALLEAQEKPIRSISYAPSADYDRELITRRFGEPAEVRTLADGRDEDEPPAELWLYPKKGLLITVEPGDKELFQYINPGQFDRLLAGTVTQTSGNAP
ncbi:hypothetical protein LV476_10525 [Guyparkeria hydrothermalis]|uniref:hypothetical protein n=1 Tax=Guyparkeria hydrothermalis TaxID=923 RepID=UPI002020DCF1|nr:hypothetical protein [Guyparkeria hydrothermalis]MCL7745370.1 hypothetical protein [Guyparkeria hydrothermalis]